MKKIYLLLLFLFITILGNAQVMISNYEVCDGDGDGLGLFDLTTKNSEILGNLNSAEYTIVFYQNFNDMQAATNPILNPTSYTNTEVNQQIFVRLTNIQSQQVSYFFISLIVNSSPHIINAASLTYCSDTELPIYNLDEALPQLIGNQQGLTVVYHLSPNDMTVVESQFAPSILPIQVLGVEISNGCGTVYSTITLNTNTCMQQACPPPNLLGVSNVTDYSANLSWHQPIGGEISLVIVLPAGSPAPNESTTGIWTQSSPYTVSGLVPNTCYSFYVRTVCNPPSGINLSEWVGPYNFCTHPNCENNGECPDNIALVAFVDANNNGLKDTGEIAFDMGSYAYDLNNFGTPFYGSASYNSPFRLFDSNPNNSYDLSYVVNGDLSNYFSSSVTYNDIHIMAGSGTQTYYFPIVQLQSFKDLRVEIIPSGLPRPGFTYVNYIKFKNKGLENMPAGTVTFGKDNAVSIISVTPSGSVATGNGFSFDFTNLAVNEERIIQVTMQVPTIPTVALGQILTNLALITPEFDDAFPINNTAIISQPIVGSYDPNDKTEAHGGKIGLDYFSDNDYLTYTIQFENTGSASAEFIRVEDLLDAGLDADSVVMLNASHPYNMRRIDKNLIWNFYNVNLPTTTANPAQSHGFIQFKVKPTSGYAVGTMIPNAANIYFDYNPAIVTNTFQTEFLATLSTSSFAANGFYMYPNPAKTFLHLGLKETSETIASINVRDVLGKSIKIIDAAKSNETTIDVSQFSKGIYFVEITTANHSKITKKLMIQ